MTLISTIPVPNIPASILRHVLPLSGALDLLWDISTETANLMYSEETVGWLTRDWDIFLHYHSILTSRLNADFYLNRPELWRTKPAESAVLARIWCLLCTEEPIRRLFVSPLVVEELVKQPSLSFEALLFLRTHCLPLIDHHHIAHLFGHLSRAKGDTLQILLSLIIDIVEWNDEILVPSEACARFMALLRPDVREEVKIDACYAAGLLGVSDKQVILHQMEQNPTSWEYHVALAWCLWLTCFDSLTESDVTFLSRFIHIEPRIYVSLLPLSRSITMSFLYRLYQSDTLVPNDVKHKLKDKPYLRRPRREMVQDLIEEYKRIQLESSEGLQRIAGSLSFRVYARLSTLKRRDFDVTSDQMAYLAISRFRPERMKQLWEEPLDFEPLDETLIPLVQAGISRKLQSITAVQERLEAELAEETIRQERSFFKAILPRHDGPLLLSKMERQRLPKIKFGEFAQE